MLISQACAVYVGRRCVWTCAVVRRCDWLDMVTWYVSYLGLYFIVLFSSDIQISVIIQDVHKNGVALHDGRLLPGDQLLEVQ